MNGTFAQLTLRRWVQIATSKGFYAAFFAVVLAATVLGPYGVFDKAPFVDRFALALKLNIICWFLGIAIAVPLRLFLQRFGVPLYIAIFAAAVAATVAIVFALSKMLSIWIGLSFNAVQFTEQAIAFLIVVHLFMVFLMREHGLLKSPNEGSKPDARQLVATKRTPGDPDKCPLQSRLPAHRRGVLYAMVAQDHYVELITDKGSELVLMRLSDAAREANPEFGMLIHRSAWISIFGVREVRKENRRMFVTLANGRELPVARGKERSLKAFVGQSSAASMGDLAVT